MLHLETIESGTLALLKQLQDLPELDGFHLVGGTALALHFGHRKSIDLDLFGANFDKELIRNAIKKNFKKIKFVDAPIDWSLFCFINEVKVDVVRYPHPLLDEPIINQAFTLYDVPDLAAMKLNAILMRGTKKDFWDIHELTLHYSLDQLISFFETKFPDQRQLISVPQALVYFEDAEHSPNPVCLKGLEWNTVKKNIQNVVKTYLS